MNTRANGTPTPLSEPEIDLTRETEDTRRKLYAAAVATHFTPTSEKPRENGEAQADPDAWQPPAYTPDQARLTVHELYGRWFVTWRRLELKERGSPAAPPLDRPPRRPGFRDGVLEYHEV